MIRTGYLRWEIDVQDTRSATDPQAREVVFLARPTHRRVLIEHYVHNELARRFVSGEVSYQKLLQARANPNDEFEIRVPDVGPRVFRYSTADRAQTIRYWLSKLQRAAADFAHEVVLAASNFPQLVIANPALRAGYARLVEAEIVRVIDGRSAPQPTNNDEPIRLEASTYNSGVPELVAAELVRDVVEPKEFSEFCAFDRITIRNGDKYYRIPRRPHALIEVWDAHTLRGHARLCVVFQDPGMPPSDELVMKYLLVKHSPDLLWKIGVRSSAPVGKFDGAPPRRYKS